MIATFHAAMVYFGLFFMLGLALGTVRALRVEPALGAVPAAAMLAQLPVMLVGAWWICNELAAYYRIADVTSDAALGAVAFIMLIGAGLATALPAS